MSWMLFLLKKIISAFLYPLGFSLLLLGIGIIVWIRRPLSRVGMILIIFGSSWLFLASLPIVSSLLVSSLEVRAGDYADPVALNRAGVKAVLVLGGDIRAGDLTPADRTACTSLVRTMEGVRLWKSLPDAKLIFSGGRVSSRKMNTADGMAILAEHLGVPKESIIRETNALDTADEANFLKPLLGGTPFALVTSATHMWRALTIFRGEGLNPIPAPADFESKEIAMDYSMFLPSVDGLYRSNHAVHEYLGMAVVWLKTTVGSNRNIRQQLLRPN